MKYLKVFLLTIFVLTIPLYVNAEGVKHGLVYECVNNGVYGNCTFEDLVSATRNVMNQLTLLAMGFCVITIAYAGFLFLTSEGNPGKLGQAKGVLIKVVIGMCFIFGAWVIVNLISSALGVTSFSFTP